MRLYLSSFRNGDHADELLRMAGSSARVAVIVNSCDGAPPDIRAEAVSGELERLGAIGVRPQEVDLRHFFDGKRDLAVTLVPYDVLWLRGGNVFTLRVAMRESGLDEVVLDGLRRDAFVYAGYSAGPCALAPSLRGLEACDDATEPRAVYGLDPVWDGLGVLDRPFVPHLESPGHAETELLAAVSARYTAEGVEHWRLRDGQVLVVDGDRTELL